MRECPGDGGPTANRTGPTDTGPTARGPIISSEPCRSVATLQPARRPALRTMHGRTLLVDVRANRGTISPPVLPRPRDRRGVG
jgi:hypothetical protein